VLVALAVGLTAAAESAAAGHRSYQPKAGAKCRAGYVRQIRKHQTWCVYKAPSSKLIGTKVVLGVSFRGGYRALPGLPETHETPNFFVLFAELLTRTNGPVSAPYTVLIEDATAHRTLASLTASGKLFCSIVGTLEGGAFVLRGEAYEHLTPIDPRLSEHIRACSLGVVSMPAVDVPAVRGVFAGNSQYAASSSLPDGMFDPFGDVTPPRAPATSLPCPNFPDHTPDPGHPPC
jgi:hypothetical protein